MEDRGTIRVTAFFLAGFLAGLFLSCFRARYNIDAVSVYVDAVRYW